MSKRLKIIFAILIVGLIILIVWNNTKTDNTNEYETVTPKDSTVINKRFFSGVIVPSKEINIMPQLSGIIENIYVKTGDKVRVGTKIAKIKLIASPANVERAERVLNSANLSFGLITNEYERNKKLAKKGFVSDSEFEAIENKWKLSKEELMSAKKQVQIAKKGYATGGKYISNIVTSTVEGTVIELPLKVGASVIEKNTFGKGSIIATIANMNSLIFKGKVNEKDLMFLHKNMKFNVSISALNDVEFETILTEIALKGTSENEIVKFNFEGKLINKNDSFLMRSGYSGIAEIILEKAENVLVIEEKNIVFRNDSAFVELLIENKLEEKNITLGISDGIIVEVKNGLSKEDKINIRNTLGKKRNAKGND